MRNLIVDVSHGDKHFLIGVTLNYKSNGIEVNSVSGLFPKESHEWIKWIQDGKAIRIGQKDKVQNLINSLRTNPAESVRIGLDLNRATNILNNFENPALPEENNSQAPGNGGGRATFMVSEERDADYMDAVKSGDAEKAGRMVREAGAVEAEAGEGQSNQNGLNNQNDRAGGAAGAQGSETGAAQGEPLVDAEGAGG